MGGPYYTYGTIPNAVGIHKSILDPATVGEHSHSLRLLVARNMSYFIPNLPGKVPWRPF